MDSSRKKVQSYLSLAADLMKSGAYEDALVELQRAQVLSDTALVQNHIAVCLEALQRTSEAQSAYTRYLTMEDEAPGTAERQKKARAAIARLAAAPARAAQASPGPPPVPPPAPNASGAPVPVVPSVAPSGQAQASAPLPLVSVQFVNAGPEEADVGADEPLFALLGCKREAANGSSCRLVTAVLVPWPTEDIIVEEEQYREGARGIGASVVARLRTELEGAGYFARTTVASECPAGEPAVRVEGRVASLTHFRGRFTATATARVVDCATGEVLGTEDFEAKERDVASAANQLAEEIASIDSAECTMPCRLMLPPRQLVLAAGGFQVPIDVGATPTAFKVTTNRRSVPALAIGISSSAIGLGVLLVGLWAFGDVQQVQSYDFASSRYVYRYETPYRVAGTVMMVAGPIAGVAGGLAGFLTYFRSGRVQAERTEATARLLPGLELVSIGGAPLVNGGLATAKFRF